MPDSLSNMQYDPAPVPKIDLTKLNRLYNWLAGFFIIALGCVVVLYLATDIWIENERAFNALLVGIVISGWGYLITLGRMASLLQKSVIIWVGLTSLLNFFGFIGSFIMMRSRVQDAQQNEAGRASERTKNSHVP